MNTTYQFSFLVLYYIANTCFIFNCVNLFPFLTTFII
uniref:Uncharacterized protein n=1 Tax=Anguilla anguilla TaxID=7936 RepID=A0A0E9SVT6_ANGAN